MLLQCRSFTLVGASRRIWKGELAVDTDQGPRAMTETQENHDVAAANPEKADPNKAYNEAMAKLEEFHKKLDTEQEYQPLAPELREELKDDLNGKLTGLEQDYRKGIEAATAEAQQILKDVEARVDHELGQILNTPKSASGPAGPAATAPRVPEAAPTPPQKVIKPTGTPVKRMSAAVGEAREATSPTLKPVEVVIGPNEWVSQIVQKQVVDRAQGDAWRGVLAKQYGLSSFPPLSRDPNGAQFVKTLFSLPTLNTPEFNRVKPGDKVLLSPEGKLAVQRKEGPATDQQEKKPPPEKPEKSAGSTGTLSTVPDQDSQQFPRDDQGAPSPQDLRKTPAADSNAPEDTSFDQQIPETLDAPHQEALQKALTSMEKLRSRVAQVRAKYDEAYRLAAFARDHSDLKLTPELKTQMDRYASEHPQLLEGMLSKLPDPLVHVEDPQALFQALLPNPDAFTPPTVDPLLNDSLNPASGLVFATQLETALKTLDQGVQQIQAHVDPVNQELNRMEAEMDEMISRFKPYVRRTEKPETIERREQNDLLDDLKKNFSDLEIPDNGLKIDIVPDPDHAENMQARVSLTIVIRGKAVRLPETVSSTSTIAEARSLALEAAFDEVAIKYREEKASERLKIQGTLAAYPELLQFFEERLLGDHIPDTQALPYDVAIDQTVAVSTNDRTEITLNLSMKVRGNPIELKVTRAGMTRAEALSVASRDLLNNVQQAYEQASKNRRPMISGELPQEEAPDYGKIFRESIQSSPEGKVDFTFFNPKNSEQYVGQLANGRLTLTSSKNAYSAINVPLTYGQTNARGGNYFISGKFYVAEGPRNDQIPRGHSKIPDGADSKAWVHVGETGSPNDGMIGMTPDTLHAMSLAAIQGRLPAEYPVANKKILGSLKLRLG